MVKQREMPFPISKIDSNASILFAVFQNNSQANGGLASITEVVLGLTGRRHVVTQMETPVNQSWLRSGAQVSILNVPYEPGASFSKQNIIAKVSWIKSLFRNNFRIFKLLRKERIEVIHCNDPAPFWHVVPAARLAGVPVVLNLRDTKSDTEKAHPKRYRRKFRLSSVVLVLSREMAEFYRELVGSVWLKRNAVRLEHVYSIVSVPEARRIEMLNESGEGNEVEVAVGVIAAFSDKKNQLEFIRETCPLLVEQIPGVKIYFIGDFFPERDEYAAICQRAVNELGLQYNVKTVGFQADIWRWYETLDVVVVPSRKEGLARCMIESLAVGTPVVSFDVCSASEILEDRQCGFVVPQGDYLALADRIVCLAMNQHSREVMAERCRDTARQLFTRHDILERYRKLYEGLAK